MFPLASASMSSATGITITNPLVKYRSLLATKAIAPDQGQLRLALHLQKLYDRLKDYEPQVEYSQRLDRIARAVGPSSSSSSSSSSVQDAVDQAPSPSLSGLSSWRSLLAAKERRDSLALTRTLTDHESAIQMRSPQGLMLHGEVGTGKSMLVDLFADCLPNRKKARWHFGTFLLRVLGRLEAFRAQEAVRRGSGEEGEYSLLRLAREMIEQHPILFLDEFQMPDRAASKILTNLMTSFFHLGGVLVATSNRMPEELAKASGVEFAPPPPPTSRWRWGLGRKGLPDRFAGPSEFAAFLEVLRARCEVWEMEGGRDYRRMESGRARAEERGNEVDRDGEWRVDGHEDLQHSVGMAGWADDAQAAAKDEVDEDVKASSPRYYAVSAHKGGDVPIPYDTVLKQATGLTNVPFAPAEMKVYGRRISVPRAYQGVTQWNFDELCKSAFGPADYSSLASTYHTIILTDVPILTWLMKNEARRFITLLDALYECRCKLYISAAAGPDDIFFPDQKEGEENADAVYAETFSEAYQDATAPFRPNILSQNPDYVESTPEPDYTHARLAGLLNADALEDDPPNKPHRNQKTSGFTRSFGRADAEMSSGPIDPDEVRYTHHPSAARPGRAPDFGKASKFTGEDERFAYKRAQSRLWEMCGVKWWARSEGNWHRPLPVEVRRWERCADELPTIPPRAFNGDGHGARASDVAMGGSVDDGTRDERSFRQSSSASASASPFRSTEEPPPKLDPSHIWSLGLWGKRAGAWGKGTEGLKDRDREREREREREDEKR